MLSRLISFPATRLSPTETLEDYRSPFAADRALLIRSSSAQAAKVPDLIRPVVMPGRPRTYEGSDDDLDAVSDEGMLKLIDKERGSA